MKMDEKTKRLIVIGVGAIMILLGLLGAVFKIKIKMGLLNQVSTILLLLAAIILFSGRRPGRNTAPEPSDASNGAPEADAEKKE